MGRPLPALRGGALLALLPPLLVGAFLRLKGLSVQVLVGDEIHAVRAVVHLPWRRIFRFDGRDHCIPLSALYRLLTDLGVELTETVMRSPSIAAGLLTLTLLPVWAARRPDLGGWKTATVWAWLLAIGPGFVYYARIARPYALSVLLATLALAAFLHWYRGAGHRWAAVYVVLGGLALWFHLGFAPFVGSVLAWGLLDRIWDRTWGRPRLSRRGSAGAPEGSRSVVSLVAVGCGLAAAVLLIIVPVWISFRRVFLNKRGAGELPGGVVADVLFLEAGSAHLAVAALFWLVALAGLVVLWRRHPRFALFGLVPVALQWLAIAVVVKPFGVHEPQVLARYVLVTMPIVTLWAAYGLVAGWRAVGSRKGALVPAAVLAALLLAGPYVADPWLRLGPFAGTNAAVVVTEPPRVFPEERVPAVYRLMAATPGEGAVVEAVTTTVALHLDSIVSLARVHERPVIVAIDTPWIDDPRLALRTVLSTEPAGVCGADARFVVLHRNWLRLEARIRCLAGRHAAPGVGADGAEPGDPGPGGGDGRPVRRAVHGHRRPLALDLSLSRPG